MSTQASCFVSVQDIRFGAYDAADSVPQTTTAEYMIKCRRSLVVSIEISSTRPSADIRQRQLRHSSSSDVLAYNLFSDGGMNTIWGNGRQTPAPVVRVDGQKNGLIYGQIYARQDVKPGRYNDSLRLTILP